MKIYPPTEVVHHHSTVGDSEVLKYFFSIYLPNHSTECELLRNNENVCICQDYESLQRLFFVVLAHKIYNHIKWCLGNICLPLRVFLDLGFHSETNTVLSGIVLETLKEQNSHKCDSFKCCRCPDDFEAD